MHLYVDFELDESYTPAQLSIRVGTSALDLEEVKQVMVPPKHVGWLIIPLQEEEFVLALHQRNIVAKKFCFQLKSFVPDGSLIRLRILPILDCSIPLSDRLIQTHFVQIAVLQNQMNGRDTHIRQIRLLGPQKYRHHLLNISLTLSLEPRFLSFLKSC